MDKKFVLKVNKIKKYFDQKLILDEVSFSLFSGQKVAFVGANGSGKSTLAKIITGEIKADDGSVEVFKNFSISYLPQEMNEDLSVEEYLKTQLRSKASKFLSEYGLGNVEEILLRKISSLSGGEKTKIFLIKIALEKSPIIILDEPTNNLDTEGLEKLEEIIKNSKSAFLIISHDRAFLDKIVFKVIYLDEFSHKIKVYDGNYSDFSEKRKAELEREEILWVENQRRKNKIEQKIKFAVEKITNKSNSFKKINEKHGTHFKKERAQQQGSSMKSNAERELRNFEEKEKVFQKRPLKIDFSDMKKSSNKVLEIKDLILPFGNQKNISLEVFSGDRVHILGKNGAGKTTLIKELLNSYTNILKNVGIKWGTNIELGYLPQTLDYGKKDQIFLEYFLEKSGKNISDARKILARFGFTDYEVEAKNSELSPGMRGRGRIALMLANNPNLLILDEPTNNLDLEVLEKFEQALENYKGTIIFVSHDKYFIEKVRANKSLVL